MCDLYVHVGQHIDQRAEYNNHGRARSSGLARLDTLRRCRAHNVRTDTVSTTRAAVVHTTRGRREKYACIVTRRYQSVYTGEQIFLPAAGPSRLLFLILFVNKTGEEKKEKGKNKKETE